jgi:polyphosphate kinase 2 (PPK2 family)
MRAYEDVLEKCNRPHAPWHIVPANAKWYRDLVVMETLVQALVRLPLRFPLAEAGIENIVISD